MPPIDDTAASPSLADHLETTFGTPSGTTDSTSSPVDTSETQAPEQTPGDAPASTPDAPVSDKDALLKIVQNVVKADPKNSASEGKPAPDSSPADAKTTETQAAEAAALEADPTDDELKAYAPRTKNRISKLLEQRNAARTESLTLKPAAEKWQQMDNYLTKHDLAAEDVNMLLGVGASLRKGDFKAFLDGVQPYVETARQALGLTLPPALQSRVDSGEMTDEAAKLLSTTQFQNSRLTHEAKARETAQEAARQAEEGARTFTTIKSAVDSWEQGVRTRDPDYEKKMPFVQRASQALIAQHGRPTTDVHAVQLAQAAYDEVTRQFSAALPQPVATRQAPSGARAVNQGAVAAPRTMLEAAKLGLAQARAKAA